MLVRLPQLNTVLFLVELLFFLQILKNLVLWQFIELMVNQEKLLNWTRSFYKRIQNLNQKLKDKVLFLETRKINLVIFSCDFQKLNPRVALSI